MKEDSETSKVWQGGTGLDPGPDEFLWFSFALKDIRGQLVNFQDLWIR